MFEILMTLAGILTWLDEEPTVPPSPPLPVLVAPKSNDGQTTPVVRSSWGFGPYWPFSNVSSGILFIGGKSPGEARPDSKGPDPNVLRELNAWAAQRNHSNRLRFNFSRILYDHVFGVEKRAQGTVTVDGGRVQIELVPTNVEKGSINSHRTTRRGASFKIVADDPVEMTFDGNEATLREASLGRSVTLPPEWGVDSPFHFAPNPFLRFLEPFQEFAAKERSQSFIIEFGSMNRPGEQVHLVLKGKAREWTKEFSCVEVLLRAGTYEPMAVRWFDPAGHKETVYVYDQVRRD